LFLEARFFEMSFEISLEDLFPFCERVGTMADPIRDDAILPIQTKTQASAALSLQLAFAALLSHFLSQTKNDSHVSS